MDLGDIVGKAKGALSNVSDEQIDDAAKAVKDKVGDNLDDVVDKVADAAKKLN